MSRTGHKTDAVRQYKRIYNDNNMRGLTDAVASKVVKSDAIAAALSATAST